MTSSVTLVGVLGTIEWRLNADDPAEIHLSAFPGWSLIPPLKTRYSDLVRSPEVCRIGPDQFLVSSEAFALRCPNAPTGYPRRFLDACNPVISWLLQRLRYLSRQFLIPHVMSMAMQVNEGHLTPADLSGAPDGSESFIRDFVLPTAVTAKHLRDLSELPLEFSVPVHSEVLLDALAAHVSSDYRKAVLYAAIAMDSFARAKLDEALSTVLATKPASCRVIARPLAGGEESVKDPIYDLLAKTDNFARFLHELPLYLLNRSLLVEKEGLYKSAVELYGARNKLAHGSHLVSPPDRESASLALETAIDVLTWLGEPGSYHIHRTLRRVSDGEEFSPVSS